MKPKWYSDHVVFYEDEAIKVLCFKSDRLYTDTPTLILPPQAAHHSCIADYGPGQSVVEMLKRETTGPVYAIEYKPCTHARRNENGDDLMIQTNIAVTIIGGEAHLIGLCQGGWQAAMYASLFPNKVKSLICAGSPLDTDADQGAVTDFAKDTPMSYFRGVVAAGGGLCRGAWMLMSFKMMNPLQHFWIAPLKRFLEPDTDRSVRFRTWYEYTQDIAGGWYIWIVENHFKKNLFVKRQLDLCGVYADPYNIKCSVGLIAGEKDDITPPGQVLDFRKVIRTPVYSCTIPKSGHIGLFIGAKGLKNEWPEVLKAVHNC